MAFARSGDFLGSSRDHHLATGISTFWPHIDDMISAGDQVQIMLDDNHRVAAIDEFVKHLGKQANIGKVQSGGRLIKDVDAPSSGSSAQFRSEFYSLSFTT